MKDVRLAGSSTDIALIVDEEVVVHEGDAPDAELLGYIEFQFEDIVEGIKLAYDNPKEFRLRDGFLEKYVEYIEKG